MSTHLVSTLVLVSLRSVTTPIVLIHGALGAASQMTALGDRLNSMSPTYAVELEGHGATPTGMTAYGIERFADNVRAFLTAKQIERVAIFGYSMGGYVALHLAASSPDVVTRVATLGTKLAWTPDVAQRETSRLDPATLRAKVPKFAAALEERHAGAGGWERVLTMTADLMRTLGATPVVDAEVLGRIKQPVRLMVGDRDTVVTLDETSDAVRTLGSGELGVLPATPHPFEQVRLPLLGSALVDFFGAA